MEKAKKTAKILNTTGTLIMVAVILLMIPLTVPKLFGLKLYGILSGSMEPTYKVGGVVYVKEALPSEISVGDVISYSNYLGVDIVTTHRVAEIREDAFITKGDANNTTDAEPVRFSRLIGKPIFYLPFFGALSTFIFSIKGLCVGIIVFGITAGLWIYADMISPGEGKKKKKPAKEKTSNGGVYVILGSALVAIALIALGIWAYGYYGARGDYDDLRIEFVSTATENTEVATASGKAYIGGNSTAGLFAERDSASIANSLASLSSKYKNIVGWISLPGTALDYPIMQAADDELYLHHSYNGKYSRVGSIFLSYENASDLSDRYNVIYGHNMLDESMFGPLLNYAKDPAFIEEHPTFFIADKENVNEYDIVSYFYVYPTDTMYAVSYYNKNDYDLLTTNILASSMQDLGLDLTAEDDIAVLSTCSDTGKYRFVVVGKKR